MLRNRPLAEIIIRLDQNNERLEDIFEGVTDMIEKPPIKMPPNQINNDTTIAKEPIFLTEKERKKLRKQNRKQIQLEKQEQIKLGLLPKPEPKLKRSNIMYALGNEVIVNPSMAEQMVREQEEKRKQAHLEHNESKKLSLEEKRLKKLRKIREDLSVVGTWAAIYRILNMPSEAQRFKVKKNARQLTMSKRNR